MKEKLVKYWKILVTALICIAVILVLFYGSMMGRIAFNTIRNNKEQKRQISVNIRQVTEFYENRSKILNNTRLDVVNKLSTLISYRESGFDEDLLAEYYEDAMIEDNIILDTRRAIKHKYGCEEYALTANHFKDAYYDEIFADADQKDGNEITVAPLKDTHKEALFTRVENGYWVSVLPDTAEEYLVDDRYFWETALENIWLGDHSAAGVVNAEGKLIYCWNSDLEGELLNISHGSSWGKINGHTYYVTLYPMEDMEVSVVALTPVYKVIDTLLSQMLSVAALLFAALVIMICLIVFLREDAIDASEQIHFFGKNFLKTQLKKFAAVGIAVSVVLAASLMLVTEMDYMTRTENEAETQISKTVELFNDYHEDTVLIEQMLESKYYMYGRMADTFVKRHPDQLTKAGLRRLADLFEVSNITVFDAEGKTVSTSSPLDHLELLSDPESSLYDLRYVLMGKEEARVEADPRLQPEESSIFAIARRNPEQIAEGLVAVETVMETVERMEPRGLLENNAGGTQFFCDKDGTILVFPNKKEVGKNVSTLGITEEMLYDGYAGRYTYEGMRYAAEVRSTKGGYALLTFRYKAFDTDIVGNALLSTLMFIIAALLFAYDGLGTKYQFTSRPALETGEEETTGARMRRVIDLCVYCCAAYFILCQWMVANGIGTHETMEYIFNGDWDRSINIFACVCNIYTIMVYYSVIRWVGALLIRVATLSGRAGETISRLMANLIKYLGAIVCLYQVFMNFGVDAKTALASVGIVGFGLTFGAQGLIEDLISGIFILFEGSYQVGDTLLIDGDPFVVKSIGIRSTRVEAEGKVRLINNSSMSGVVNVTGKSKAAE